MNVAAFVLERARREPDAVAIHFPVGRHEGGGVRYALAVAAPGSAAASAYPRSRQKATVPRQLRHVRPE